MKTSTVLTLALLVSSSRLATAADTDAQSMTTALSKRGVAVTVGRAGDRPPEWTGDGTKPKRTDSNRTFAAVGIVDGTLSPRWPERLLACHVTAMTNVQMLADVEIDALVPGRPQTTRSVRNDDGYLLHSAQRWGEPAFELMAHVESAKVSGVEGHAIGARLAVTRVTLPSEVTGVPTIGSQMALIGSRESPVPMEAQQLLPAALKLDEPKLNRALDFFARAGFRLTRVYVTDDVLLCEVQLSEADMKRSIKQAATTAAKE